MKIDYKYSTTLEMNSLVGFPIYIKTTRELEDEGFLCKTLCIFIELDEYDYKAEEYIDLYKEYIVEGDRNKVVEEIINLINKKTLITTRFVKHAELLNKSIKNSLKITGGTEKKERKESFNKFKNNKKYTLVGSTRIFSRGVDIPDLDVVVNTVANKSRKETIQLCGRVKRLCDGKELSYYIDFIDNTLFFKEGSKERMKVLEEFGNKVIILNIKDIKSLKDIIK
jgi:superfamily II DNA or RNA helicase